MDSGNTKLIVANTSSGVEELAKKVPRAHVVSAFNMVPSKMLFGMFAAKRKNIPASLVYCGDHQRSKDLAATLTRDLVSIRWRDTSC